MRVILTLCLLLAFVSCSSVNKTGDDQTDKLIQHLAKGKTLISKDFDEKFQKDGLLNGHYVAIGTVIDKYSRNEASLKVLAEANATAKLLAGAPLEFKKMVQRTVSSSDDSGGSAEEISVSISEVKALTGIVSNYDDSQCVSYAIPNQDMKYDVQKECRVLLRVPTGNLLKAYDFTLNNKYGISEKDVKESLKDQLFKSFGDGLEKKLPEREPSNLPTEVINPQISV